MFFEISLFFMHSTMLAQNKCQFGNLTQNSNVALMKSPNVVFRNIDTQLPYYYSECRKDWRSNNYAIMFNELIYRYWGGCTKMLKFLRVDSTNKISICWINQWGSVRLQVRWLFRDSDLQMWARGVHNVIKLFIREWMYHILDCCCLVLFIT